MIEAAKLQVEIVADSDSAQRDIEGFGKKLDNMSRDLTRTGGVLSAAVAAPLIGIGTAAVNSAASFEQSMNILQQVSGASESAMASMSEQALTLGADTVFSANEAASAMVELAKAGMDTEDVMASIGGVMDLAAAGGVALSEAASITAATLQAFSLEANEANRIADLFAATANASAADITDLSQGMRQAGFAFNLANQPVENLAASLAVLTNVGLTGSDAGTALKNAFMRMMNPTEEAKDVINDLGLSFYDASGNMKQLPDIIDMLNIATAGLTNQQRDAALATIFMSDGMKAMIPLMNLGKEGFNAMLTEVTKTGAATEVADARMKGLRGGIEELRGSIDTALITAAMPFLDMLGEMARGAADLITEFSGLPQPVIDSSLAFLATLASAGLLMLALGGLTAAITAMNPVLLLAAVGAALFAAAWAGNWGDIQGKAEDAINAITPLIDNLITKIGELGTAVSTAFSNTTFPTLDELVRDFKAGDFQKLATTIRTTAVDLLVNLDTELNITGKATQLRGQLLGIINGVGSAIAALDIGENKVNMDSLRDKVLGGLTTALDGISFGEGSTVFAGFVGKLATAVQGLDLSGIDWAGILQTALLGKIGLALKGIQWVIGSEDFGTLRTSVVAAFKAINWGDLGTAFVGLASAVVGQLSLIAQDIITDVNTAFAKNTGIKLLPTDFKFILPTIPPITLPTGMFDIDLSTATQNWSQSMNKLANTINNQDWTPFGSHIIKAIHTGINQALSTDVSGMETFANNFAFSVRSTLGSIKWGELDQSFGRLAMAVRGGIYEVFGGMGKELGPIIADLNSSFSTTMETLGTDIRLGIAGGFVGLDTEFSAAMTIVGANMRTGITTGLTGIDTAFSTTMETVGADIRTSIGTFFGDINTEFSNKLTTLGADIRSYIANAFAGLFGGLSSAQGSTVGGNIGIGSGDSPSLIEDEGRIGKAKYKTIPQPWLAGSAAGTAGSARQEPLDWTQFVTPLLWETYVLPLDWATIVTALDWGMYLMSLAWDNFVTQLAWANYITRVSWDTYVPRLNWGSYVSNLNWDSYIGDMSWGNYVDRLDWARFVPRLAASAIGGGGGASTASVSMARASTAGMVGVAGMATAAGGGINVYIDKVSSDMDIEVIVNRVVRKIQQRVG